MRRHIITSIFLALICSQVAQGKQTKPTPKSSGQNAAAIKVYPAGAKRIRIVAGKERTLIDLKDDISGCLKVYDPQSTKSIAEQPLGIRVKDRVSKNEKHYLVLLTSAQSNCNIQGYCGAATDYTLIWLKLGASLKLEEKKSAVIEDCKSNIYIADPEFERLNEPPIKLVRGKLTIEYGNTLDDKVRTLSRLVYDRNSPEQGFFITESEKKSQ